MKKIPLTINNHNHPAIAIIGFGRFGQLLTQIFIKRSDANILVVSGKKQFQTHRRLSFVNLQRISSADLIIPCVPISAFGKTIQKIAPMVKKTAIVMDVCTVKIIPVQLMKSLLPKHVQIIASHPMFGPDSFYINKDLRLVLHNISADRQEYVSIKSFFKQLSIKVIELSPHKHDQLLAWSLGYSYLVGKIGQKLKIRKTPIDTFDFKLLLQNMKIVSSDSEELFMDMQTYNPFANEVHKRFSKVTQKTLGTIRQNFIRKMR